MNYHDAIEATYQELKQGYRIQDGQCRCLWCDAPMADEPSAIGHAQTHTDRERFLTLLGADSLVKLSPEDKRLLLALFETGDLKAAAKACGISHQTMRVKRSRLYYDEYQQAKLKLLLLDLLFAKQPMRKYEKAEKPSPQDTRIPYFTKDRVIRGYAEKDALHTDPQYRDYDHATTILLPVTFSPTGDPVFLCENRYAGFVDLYARGEDVDITVPIKLDGLGGHLEKRDLADGGEATIDQAAYLRCALREACEEAHLRSKEIRPSDLRFFYHAAYTSGYSPGQRYNNEQSAVYLLFIEPGTDVRFREETIDTLGRAVRSEYPVRAFSLAELLALYRDSPAQLCDGLGRVLKTLATEPERMAQLQGLLRQDA